MIAIKYAHANMCEAHDKCNFYCVFTCVSFDAPQSIKNKKYLLSLTVIIVDS